MSDSSTPPTVSELANQNMTMEFTVEPFVESAPGPHVQAAIAAAQDAENLVVDVGPFGTLVSGEGANVLMATDKILAAAFENGATRVSLQLTREP